MIKFLKEHPDEAMRMWDESGLDKELLSYPALLLDLYRGERLLHIIDGYRLNACLISMSDAVPPPQTFSSPLRPSPMSPLVIPPSSPVPSPTTEDPHPPLGLFLAPPPGFSPTPTPPLPRHSPLLSPSRHSPTPTLLQLSPPFFLNVRRPSCPSQLSTFLCRPLHRGPDESHAWPELASQR